MKSKYPLLVVVSVLLIFSSCRKEIKKVESPEDYSDNSFGEVFDAFWNGMNNNYVFWDIDTTNWDDMYNRYRPVFAGLDINKSGDVEKSVEYFREMTSGLIDSHYKLSFFSPIADSTISPSYDRKLKAGTLRPRYVFYDYDAKNYLDPGYIYGIDSVNLVSGNQTEVVTGTIGGNILYIGINQFNLTVSYESANNGVKRALQYFIDYLRNPPPGFKGVIVDVRGNEGGDTDDLNLLLGNLVSDKLPIGSTRYKNGNGRLDYTPWAPAYLNPRSGAIAVHVPVVALTDIWSTSLAELAAMAIRALPTGKIVGEKTWGATGPLLENKVLNGGQFTAADFTSVYTSSAMFKYIDGKIYEGQGFPPDYPVPFNADDFQTSGDTQLEKALSLMP